MAKTTGNPTRGEADSYAAVLERQNRRLWMGNTVQAFINVSLCITVLAIFPLKHVEPLFIRFGDPTDKVFFLIFYTMIDRRTGTDEELRRAEYIATLSYVNRALTMDTEEFQMNPTGITIVNYDIQARAYEDLSR